MNAPIVLFAFNRPLHTQATLSALERNPLAAESNLYVFCDGPRSSNDVAAVNETRDVVRSAKGFKLVVMREADRNLGLARSVTMGVSEVISLYGRAIILEDDIVVAPSFLRFMNESLNAYEADDSVGSVSGYSFPLSGDLPEMYFLRIASSWGWATWARAWNDYEPNAARLLWQLKKRRLVSDFDCGRTFGYSNMLRQCVARQNDSWAIRWYASCFLRNRLTLFPRHALAQNIGHDGSGRHCSTSSVYDVDLAASLPAVAREEAAESPSARFALEAYFRSIRPTLRSRFKMTVRKTLGAWGGGRYI